MCVDAGNVSEIANQEFMSKSGALLAGDAH